MPRPKSAVPSYLLHKPSGQAYVRLPSPDSTRRVVYLGPHGSAVSRQEYARLVAQLGNRPATGPVSTTRPAAAPLSVNELILAFLRFAEGHYHRPADDGVWEADQYRWTCRPLRKLFGLTPATEFGPLSLKRVRAQMVEDGLSRPVVNARVGRIKRLFKWAAGEELIPFEVYHRLTAVAGLGKGRTTAPEPEPVGPVAPELVVVVLPRLSATVRAMVRFQQLTGCRPQDVCRLTPAAVDRSGAVWVYRPAKHKGAWRGRGRTVFVGPQAQAVLAPFLVGDPDKPAFSPRAATADRHAALRAARRSPVQPSQQDRTKPDPKRAPGDGYTPRTYARAVARARKAAGVDGWAPNQLRHAHATEVRRRYGLEAAGAVLGHAKMSATEVYAEKDLALAERVAREVG